MAALPLQLLTMVRKDDIIISKKFQRTVLLVLIIEKGDIDYGLF